VNLYKIKEWHFIGAQKEAWKRLHDGDCFLLFSPTASGKTEAVEYPALEMDKRIIMLYPTKSLIEDQISRCKKDLKKLKKEGIQKKFIVDTGDASALYTPEDNFNEPKSKGRHLYKADVILTTFDKFMYRFFGYGWRRWNYMYPYGLREAKPIIVFDEAHSYGTVAFENFVLLVNSLMRHGIQVVPMSATLPEELRNVFCLPIVSPKGRTKYKGKKQFKWVKCKEEDVVKVIASTFKNEMKNEDRTIIILNTVKRCIEVYEILKKFKPFIYHGRMLPSKRKKIYEELKEDEKKKPYVLISTHAIEVGCDLDATLMITELCNSDGLIQRAGRCARDKETEGRLFVLGDRVPQHLRDPDAYDYDKFKSVLSSWSGKTWNDELEDEIRATIIHVKKLGYQAKRLSHALYNQLYSYVYEGDISGDLLYEQGVVVTRSWTPSVPVIFIDEKERDKKDDEEWVKKNFESEEIAKVSFPIDMLWKRTEPAPPYSLYVRYGEEDDWVYIDSIGRRSLNLYLVDVLALCFVSSDELRMVIERGVKIPPHLFDRKEGKVEKSFHYLNEGKNGEVWTRSLTTVKG
jgi:CRISPR-associated endonuclease/helicase Cas3